MSSLWNLMFVGGDKATIL